MLVKAKSGAANQNVKVLFWEPAKFFQENLGGEFRIYPFHPFPVTTGKGVAKPYENLGFKTINGKFPKM